MRKVFEKMTEIRFKAKEIIFGVVVLVWQYYLE